jgi:hypothetical protein
MFLPQSKVMRVVLAACVMLSLSNGVVAQTGRDACQVYVVDVARSRRAFDNFRETGNEEADARALSVGQTIFPEFFPVIGEEELTTKHYTFPGRRLVITASVFYTDESLASHGVGEYKMNNQSMVIGVLVSNRARPSAIGDASGDAAITEVTYDEYTNKVRAKKYVRVRGRNYLLGIECDCMSEKQEK